MAGRVASLHSRGLFDLPWTFWQLPSLALPPGQVSRCYWTPSNTSFFFGLRGLLPWAPLHFCSTGLALNWNLLWIRPHLCLWRAHSFGGQILLDLFLWHTGTEGSQSQLGLPQQIRILLLPRVWGQFAVCKDEQSRHWGRGRSPGKAAEGPIAKMHSAWRGRAGCWCSAWEISVWRPPLLVFCFHWLVCLVFSSSVSQINTRDFTNRGNSCFQQCCMMRFTVNRYCRGMVSTALGSCSQMAMIGKKNQEGMCMKPCMR